MRDEKIIFEVAGIGVAFEFADRGFKALAARRYKNFNSAGGARYRFSVSSIAGSQTPFRPGVSQERGILRLKRGDFDCVLNLKTGLGALKAAPRIQAFDSFLRSFYSWLLPREGGLLIHAASIVTQGRGKDLAYIFPGKSGAGKSTLSRLAAKKCFLLSDELAPVRKIGSSFYAYGSPFWGEMRRRGENKRFALGGIYKISKAGENSVSKISGAAAFGLLMRCSMNFSTDAETAGLILGAASELAEKKAAGELRFSKNGDSFLELIQSRSVAGGLPSAQKSRIAMRPLQQA